MLSNDGKCKAFDESGDGYVRSDGCVVVFMQKTSQARRVYSTVLNVRTNTDGSKAEGITYPNGEMQKQLIREAYNEIGLNAAEVTFIEADGTGTTVGDTQEVNAITDCLCGEARASPLLIGSVKSNMGHAEAASGLCALVKVLLAMETGIIPANLHFSVPNPNLYGILDGRIKIVDRNTPWRGGIVGVNCVGFGGVNAHAILKSNPKQKLTAPSDGIPCLVTFSGRTNEAIDLLLNEIEKNKDDVEFLSLINEIHIENIPSHYYRGYAVVGGTTETIRESDKIADAKRPIWYIYSGMGSQWASMAKDLMQMTVFRKTINRCAAILHPKGVDLIALLTESDDAAVNHISNTIVAIVAVQIGLTDILTELGIRPAGIIGHSIGEIPCAYADGCLTAEQAMLIAYYHGHCVATTPLEKGMMASVGLSWLEIKVYDLNSMPIRIQQYFHLILLIC